MKAAIAIALFAVMGVTSITSASAAQGHHRECHKVRVHHHWATRCR